MAAIWKRPVSIASITAMHEGTATEHIGLEFTEVGDDYIKGRIPVDGRTSQPYGILHGGMSVVLAETLGSVAAVSCLPEGQRAVGLDINANHLRAATKGWVTGIAKAVHVGSTTQVWQIELRNDDDQLTCVARLTMAVLRAR
jgi:uncharacterized protein (TIGR00369 family)